jgi:hypothetical protein
MNYKAIVLAFFLSWFSAVQADESTIYEGDQRLACEALLCLTMGWGESSCRPAIRKFFSIWSWKPSDLFNKRMSFLNLCPSEMSRSDQILIVDYSGRCQGERFDSYVSGYRSYATVETEHGGRMRSACSWNERSGSWTNTRAFDACRSSYSAADRLAMANQDCAGFRAAFGLR